MIAPQCRRALAAAAGDPKIDQKPMIRIMFIRHPRAIGAPQALFALLLLAGIASALVAAFATSA